MIPSGLIPSLNNSGLFFLDLTIAQNTSNLDIYQLAKNNGWDERRALHLNFEIASGVTISSTSTATPALDVKTFPTGSVIKITNRGSILGKGGNGGAGGVNSGNGGIGSNGGIAFKTAYQVTFDNLGIINGGDGGQGGSAAARSGGTSGITASGCGGSLSCIGGSCANGFCNTNVGANGSVGGSSGRNGLTGGLGSNAAYGTSVVCNTGAGCSGAGCNRIVSCLTGLPGNGGLAGPAISGDAFISYLNKGNRNGAIA
jgi:hypothetical protein